MYDFQLAHTFCDLPFLTFRAKFQVLLTEPPMNPLKNRQKMVEVNEHNMIMLISITYLNNVLQLIELAEEFQLRFFRLFIWRKKIL